MVARGFCSSKIRRRQVKIWLFPFEKSEKRSFSAGDQWSPLLACNIKTFMQLNVGNGYGRSAVPGFLIHKCWAQRYTAANSPSITGNAYVSLRNGHNRSLHWRIISLQIQQKTAASQRSGGRIFYFSSGQKCIRFRPILGSGWRSTSPGMVWMTSSAVALTTPRFRCPP